MSKIIQLYSDKDKKIKAYPKTLASQVYMDDLTTTINSHLDNKANKNEVVKKGYGTLNDFNEETRKAILENNNIDINYVLGKENVLAENLSSDLYVESQETEYNLTTINGVAIGSGTFTQAHHYMCISIGNNNLSTINVSWDFTLDDIVGATSIDVAILLGTHTSSNAVLDFVPAQMSIQSRTTLAKGNTVRMNATLNIPSNSKYFKIYPTFYSLNQNTVKYSISNIQTNMVLKKENEIFLGSYRLTEESSIEYSIDKGIKFYTTSVIDKMLTDVQNNKFLNAKINFLGDSITEGYGTTKAYHQYMSEELGLGIARNYGIGGSTISDSANPMHTRANSMDNDADIIFCFGGTNDFYKGVSLGVSFTESNNTIIPNTSTNTFYGALHSLCRNLIKKYPNKKIILITPIHREIFGSQPTELQKNSANLYIADYINAIKEIGKFYSIPVCDLWSNSGLQPNIAEHKALYFSSNDGLHPNVEGHKIISKKIISFLNNI